MTQRSKEQATDEIVDLFLSVPWQQRETVISYVRNNPYFCFECGYGSKENPNPGCQCWNDE
jgi:hypothetical protein